MRKRIDFWSKVEKTESCWIWLGYLNRYGYGQLQYDNKMYLAHRLAYELIKGQIKSNLDLDHLCHNRECVNPNHLEPVTHKENISRNESKTHCSNGHKFTEGNMYVFPNGKTKHCKICRRQWDKKRYYKHL